MLIRTSKQRSKLTRRMVLRGILGGVAVQVALPPLEAVLNESGDAFANNEPIPKKFGVWFFGDGVRREHWTPSTVGSDWAVSSELAPLVTAGLKPYVSVISGMNAMGNSYVHAGPAAAVLTGTGLVHPEGDAGTPEGPSIDVMVSGLIGTDTPFPDLHTGLYNFLGNGSAYQALSHRGPDAPNYPVLDAREVYKRLFGPGSPGEARSGSGPTLVDNTLAIRKSVLDAVLSDCTALSLDLGASDRQRVEQHCDSIRALEKRLSGPTGTTVACEVPASPENITQEKAGWSLYSNSQHFKEVNQTMSLLLAHALLCDLTRVFTHCFTNPASHWSFNPAMAGVAGDPTSFHVLTHDEPGDQPKVHAGVVWQMGCLADTLLAFKNTAIGDKNLLDYMSLLVTSDCAVGKTHDPKDYPVLIVGAAGGTLKGNVHYRSNGESVTRATLTAARAVVDPAALPAFGTGQQLVTDPVAELFI